MNSNEEISTNENPLQYKLLDTITSSWKSQALFVAAKLQLANNLSESPKSAAELAKITNTDAPSLHRLLRGLCSLGVCLENKNGLFELTQMGSLLRTDQPNSLHHWTLWWGTSLWRAWSNLMYSVSTGNSAREKMTGKQGFGHLEDDPEAASIFNKALVELTRIDAKRIANGFDFSGFKSIVDVGGGYGELLITIMKNNPGCRGILFDLPHAVEEAKSRFHDYGLYSRCEFISGDFFEMIPAGADAYILKSIIHDWNDEKSKMILSNCRRTMNPDSRLLIAEQILPDRFTENRTHQSLARSDLSMLVALGAGERTESEFKELLTTTGFKIVQIKTAGPTFSLLEAAPA